eukprot:5559435-Pleurochrysis_carterae.AAC.2
MPRGSGLARRFTFCSWFGEKYFKGRGVDSTLRTFFRTSALSIGAVSSAFSTAPVRLSRSEQPRPNLCSAGRRRLPSPLPSDNAADVCGRRSFPALPL